MLPIFNEYKSMLNSFGIDLSEYDDCKLWVDNLIIKGFDHNGNERKILRLKVNDDLEYEYSFYTKTTKKNGTQIIKPKNEELETWEETYTRLESSILERERESIKTIQDELNKYPNYSKILPNSMGKDSKLTEYLVSKVTNNYKVIFNNTTLDVADVYKEVKNRPEIEIVTVKDKNGKNKSFYQMIQKHGLPNRFLRWCCDIFKEGGTIQYLENKKNIMLILGMRNDESATRADYKDEWRNNSWTEESWIGVLPIRKWNELELWLYTIHNNIPINSKYKKGYQRVGCGIACPFYTKSTWILDKYWYTTQFNRFHNLLKEDFEKGEKWCRINCTEKEYHLNWNGGLVREEPNDEVIEEFQKYKGFKTKELAEQYFNKKCSNCNKKVHKKDEVAMNLKLFGRQTNKFLCKKCIMKEMGWTKEDWDREVEKFKQQGCDLF